MSQSNLIGLRRLLLSLRGKNNAKNEIFKAIPVITERAARIADGVRAGQDGAGRGKRLRKVGDLKKPI